MNTLQDFNLNRWLRSTPGQIFLMLLLAAAVYLMTEHTVHVLGLLPYALFLLCPIMMMFMHGGHGDHNGDHAGHSAQLGDGKSDSPQSQRDSGSDHPQRHVH